MIRKWTWVALVSVAGLGTIVPVQAHSPTAGTAGRSGLICGSTSSNDPTGVIDANPNTQRGVVEGGPVTVTDDEGNPANNLTIRCSIQINAADHAAPDAATAMSDPGTGITYLPPTDVTYEVAPGDDVYLCTEYAWDDSGGGHHVYQYDADGDPNNGIECELEVYAVIAGIHIYVGLPHGDICMTVYLPIIGSYYVCVPWGSVP